MSLSLKKTCVDLIKQNLLQTSPDLQLGDVELSVSSPPNPALGDFAVGCFPLAKLMKQNPVQMAAGLASSIKDPRVVVTAAGPYLNFKFELSYLKTAFFEEILSQKFFSQKLLSSPVKTMIEFSQPNTHKELHVGHMRNACLGDAIVRILRFAGTDVIASTFPGDVGTHVAKCLWYLKYHNQEPVPQSERGEWLGRMYSAANTKLEDELGTDKEANNREQLTQILYQLEHGSGEYYDLWKETREWSIDLMKHVYQWAGIQFDVWYWESQVNQSSIEYVKKLYKEGRLVQSKGAVGMDLEAEGLGFCLLLKSDGNGLYATKDLELARRKFEDYKIEKNVYVVDVRQALHFQQVFKTLEKLGFEQAKNCYHLQYNFVELPDGAMSSRKGNIVPLMALVKGMEKYVIETFLERYRGDWSDKEITTVAHQVAQGAIKYGMLRIDANKKIVFDMKEWLKIDGESGPFIQYSSARIASLLRKAGEFKATDVQYESLSSAPERDLVQHLLQFQSVVQSCAEQMRPAPLCTYLYELAKKFNFFYHECPILKDDQPETKKARLALSQSTKSILDHGLGILGIPVPERM